MPRITELKTDQGPFVGTELSFQQSVYADSARTTLVDAAQEPTVVVTKPDGTTLSSAPQVTHPSTGVYKIVVNLDMKGTWRITWTFTDADDRAFVDKTAIKVYA